MNNQTVPRPRKPASKKNTTGVKAMIMAASVGITLGGWGILAAGQVQNAQAAPSSQAFIPSSSNQSSVQTNTQNSQSNSTIFSVPSTSRPTVIGRTRSSR